MRYSDGVGWVDADPSSCMKKNLCCLLIHLALRDCILNLPNMFAGRAMNTDFMWEGRGHVMDIHADQGDTIDPVIDGELFQGLRQLTITRGPEVEVPQLS